MRFFHAHAPFFRYQGFMLAFMLPMLITQPTLTFAGLLLLVNLTLYAIVTHNPESGTSQSRVVAIVSSPEASLALTAAIVYHVIHDALRIYIPVSVMGYVTAMYFWQTSQGLSPESVSLTDVMTALKFIIITAYLLAWIPALLHVANKDKEDVCE